MHNAPARRVISVMRRRPSAIGTMLALAAASIAWAQEGPRPRLTVTIDSPAAASAPAKPLLRKPLGLDDASGSVAALSRTGPTLKGGFTPLTGLNPKSASANAAQCRTQCAKARYICTAHDAGDCDTVWGQCVVRCSGANYTDTPDLAFSAAYRPGR
jgi:hypothetical protein